MRKLARARDLGALALVVITGVAAQDGPLPGGSLEPNYYRFAANFYQQLDRGGDPRLDEKMRIFEPAFLISHTLGEDWVGRVKVQSDVISAASNTFTPAPGGGWENDGGIAHNLSFTKVEASVSHALSREATIGGGLNFSAQRGYLSRGAFLVGTLDTESKNDTFALRASGFYDNVALDRFDGTNAGEDIRRTLSFGPGWTHIIDGETVAAFNWDVTLQDGFLATPNNPVTAAGMTVPEALPDTRVRHSFHTRVRHLLLDRLAVEPGLGLYSDDWGARAFNLELAAFWEAGVDSLILEPKVRYHSQSEIDSFLPDTSPSMPEFRTQDADLGRFTSTSMGLTVVLLGKTAAENAFEIDVGGEYTRRSDGLSSFSVSIGAMWTY